MMESNHNTNRKIVLIASTMRSGSTLLKALLSTAPDVSSLPEINFQRYTGPSGQARIAALAEEPIVLLKRPGWFNEIHTYPRLPEGENVYTIVLARDAVPTILSVRRMCFGKRIDKWLPTFGNRWLANEYWRSILENSLTAPPPGRQKLVRYEDLVNDPVRVTAELFQYIGSEQTGGTDTYNPPDNYRWRWGTDDGGPRIKTLKVQPPRPARSVNPALEAVCAKSPRIRALRERLGYDPDSGVCKTSS